MANELDEIFFDFDADSAGPAEPLLFQRSTRVVTTAHPFSDDDLRAFAASGEHPGLD